MKFDSVEEFTQALINNSNYYFEDGTGDLFYFEDGDLWFKFVRHFYEGDAIPLSLDVMQCCLGHEFNMVEK